MPSQGFFVLVLETVPVARRCVDPNAWRGAALLRNQATSRYSFQRSILAKNVATGGSRESPSGSQLYGPGVNESKR